MRIKLIAVLFLWEFCGSSVRGGGKKTCKPTSIPEPEPIPPPEKGKECGLKTWEEPEYIPIAITYHCDKDSDRNYGCDSTGHCWRSDPKQKDYWCYPIIAKGRCKDEDKKKAACQLKVYSKPVDSDRYTNPVYQKDRNHFDCLTIARFEPGSWVDPGQDGVRYYATGECNHG